MFKCQNEHCDLPDRLVPARQPVNRIVTERRKRQYEKKIRKKYSKKVIGVELVDGWEIVTEICVCPKCFRKLTGMTPRLVQSPAPAPRKKYEGFNTKPPRKKKWQNPNDRKKSSKNYGNKSGGSSKKQGSKSGQSRKPVVQKVNALKVVKE